MFLSRATPQPPSLEAPTIFIDIFVLLPVIKIESNTKQSMRKISYLIPDYYTNNINFAKKGMNWPMNLRQKLFYIPFQDVSKKCKIF